MQAASIGLSQQSLCPRILGRHILAPWRAKAPICFFVAFLLLLAALPRAGAQTSEDAESRRLDQIAASLQSLEMRLEQRGLKDEQLQGLRDQVAPLASDLEILIGRLAPHLAALQTRLQQLGPSPDPKAAPEDPQVTADRDDQQRAHDAADALLKRAKLLSVQADQIQTQIDARRRSLFTHSLIERGPSVLTANFWSPLAEELPRDIQSARNLVIAWGANLSNKLAGWRATAFGALLALVIFLYWPLARMAHWVLARESAVVDPSRLQKILAAWWIALVVASLPIAAIVAIGWIFQGFDLVDSQYHTLMQSIAEGIARVALTAGVARGLLAPEHANWRLLRLSDAASRALVKLAIAISVIFAATRIGEAFAETIGATPTMLTAIRAACAGLVAVVIIVSLWRYGTRPDKSDDVFGPRVAIVSDWLGPLRIPCWASAIAIIICVLTGFLFLASFMADQIVWVTGVTTLAMMASVLVDASIVAGCRPAVPFGRGLAAIIGIPEQSLDQLTVLLSGVVRAIAFIVAWLLILAPWGIRSADVSSYFRAAFFGFKVDDIKISLASIGFALVIFLTGSLITRRIVRWLDKTYLPHTSLDIGLRNAIKTSFGYMGISVAALFSLAYVGVSFERLAIVASALSIGIGFGLQSIVNNFVSGLIILWERAIRVGDWIVVGSDEGFVRRINVRSTEIETFDRAAVIIPNSNMVTGVVKNFVRMDRVGRIRIAVDVDLSADPEKVRDLLLDIACSHKLVLEMPAALVTFTGYDATHLHFELFCFVADVATLVATRSDLNFEIFKRFKLEGWLAGPPPSSIVTLKGLEQFEPLLQKVIATAGNDGLGSAEKTG